jgi:hypothetical protein
MTVGIALMLLQMTAVFFREVAAAGGSRWNELRAHRPFDVLAR